MADPRPYQNPPRLPEGEVDLDALLEGPGPLEIEIGPGRGAFIIERAGQQPEVRIIGLEIRRKWACIVDERLIEAGLSARARVFSEDARSALPRLVPEASVGRVFFHFPDPWWKKKHQKRMVIVDPVIDEVVRLLVDGGELYVQTDVPERAERYEAHLSAVALLEPAGDDGTPHLGLNPYGEARSNREKHAERDGLPIHRLRYRRKPR